MMILGLLLGAAIGAVVLVAWYKWHQQVSGGTPSSAGKPGKPPAEDLEAFIAAYRRGEVSPAALAQPTPAAAPAKAADAPATMAATMDTTPGTAAAQAPARREAFLSGPAKLVYLACRSGLRDHHCFAGVRLQSLCTGRLDASLQASSVDLLVCNAALEIVAAIDIAGEASPADAAKADCLRLLGIRHLRLSPGSLPKPDGIRDLLYRA